MKKTWIIHLSILLGIMIVAGCGDQKKVKTTSDTVSQVFSTDPKLKDLTGQIANSPEDATLYFRRAGILRAMRLDSLALKDYKKASSLDTGRAEYYSAIGDLLFEHKDLSGSVEWLQKAILKNPKDKKAHLKIAKLFLYMQDYGKGFAEINIVLRQDVYDPEAYYLKGMLYKDMKDTAKAISNFLTAEQVAPEYKDAIVQLGLLYSAKKDPIALKYLDKAFKIDSLDVFPIFAKGVFYQQNKDLQSAKTEYRKCIIKDNHYVDAYFNMGAIYLQQDSFAKAWKQYDLAIKTDPTNPTAYYNRGVCSELMDSIKNAVEDYKQAISLDTTYKSPKEALRKIKRK